MKPLSTAKLMIMVIDTLSELSVVHVWPGRMICIFFLIDFIVTFRAASSKTTYFINERGWLDLIGSIPTVGIFFKYGSLLRLARLSRAFRIAENLGRKGRGDLMRDVLHNRSQYAGFIIILLAIIILAFASILVLQFESASRDANIKTVLQFLDLRRGPVNLLLQALGVPPVLFMGSAELFPSIYVWTGVWQYTGFSTIIYLAALTTVDPALHEAGVMDGANLLQRIWHIDIPGSPPRYPPELPQWLFPRLFE